MSFTFKITDTKELDRFRRAFPTMAARAVNRVAQGAAVEAKRTILQNYNVTPDVLDGNITVYEAKVKEGDIRAKILAKGKFLSATNFAPQQTSRGVSIEIRKGVRREIPGAFIATSASKKMRSKIKKASIGTSRSAVRAVAQAVGIVRAAVFIRKTAKRLPIREIGGTSVANLFSSGIVTQAMRRFGGKAIRDELTKEINDYQSRRA